MTPHIDSMTTMHRGKPRQKTIAFCGVDPRARPTKEFA